MAARLPDGRPLVGAHVRLDQAVAGDAEGIFAALDHDEVWAAGYNGGPAARPADPDGWRQRIDGAVADERARAEGRPPLPSVAAEVMHFLGEVEVVFGLWAVVLMIALTATLPETHGRFAPSGPKTNASASPTPSNFV